MKLKGKSNNQRGEAAMMFVLLGVVITVGLFYGLQHFQDRHHNITIHVPHVEAH